MSTPPSLTEKTSIWKKELVLINITVAYMLDILNVRDMNNLNDKLTMPTEHLFLKMTLDAWKTQITRTTKLFDSLSDEQLQREVAPGRNTGVYLLGHLAAVHDALISLMRFGERLYPELDKTFVDNPDGSGLSKPPVSELRLAWTKVNEKLSEHFDTLTVKEWFERHAAISEADFDKEPHRNRLNVILNRTSHLANHLGQLTFLKPRE